MHLTWELGDPVIQLNFPNPLNVSVQVGDIAYFSNPTEVGLQVQSWTATTTPHLSNPQGGIMMIGEIIQIIPWDNTVSSIICQMPQVLFNQYFDQIVEGGCVSTPSGNPTCANPTFDPVEEIVSYEIIFGMFDFPSNEPFGCCNRIPGYSSTIAVPQTAAYEQSGGPGTHWDFFFDNPTLSVHDYMLHRILPETYAGNIATTSPLSIINQNQWCLLQNDHPNYVPGQINFWAFYTPVNWTDENGLVWGPFITAGLLIDFLIGLYPTAGFFQGMSFDDLANARNNIPGFPSGVGWSIGGGPSPITGTYSDTYTETCTQGSFIMFSKDNKVNMSDMLGYYASVELRNSSKTEAELFNVGTTFFESSK